MPSALLIRPTAAPGHRYCCHCRSPVETKGGQGGQYLACLGGGRARIGMWSAEHWVLAIATHGFPNVETGLANCYVAWPRTRHPFEDKS